MTSRNPGSQRRTDDAENQHFSPIDVSAEAPVREPEESIAYNVKAVVRATGVAPDTLRAWERRYGIPNPYRTPGGHRLYTQEDVDLLKWLVARQAEGISISRATDHWRKLTARGLITTAMPQELLSPNNPHGRSGLTEFSQAWVRACLAFDEPSAEAILSQAFAQHSPERVCVDVIQLGLAQIGNHWYSSTASVQQEHFASELAMRRLGRLYANAPIPWRSEKIVVGCPPNEEHTFGMLLSSVLLRDRGFGVLFLGANVPTAMLDAMIGQVRPSLVFLGAQRLSTALKLAEVGQILLGLGVPLAYGGGIFSKNPDIRARMPGHFVGDTIAEVPASIERIISEQPPISEPEPIGEEYLASRRAFREHEDDISQIVGRRLLGHNGFGRDYLTIASTNFSRDIDAALAFGRIEAIETELGWLRSLLANYNLPPDLLQEYLVAYRDSAKSILPAEASILLDWLDRLADSATN